MKKVIIFLMLLILSIASFSQETTSSQPLTKEDYLTKSRHQKTAAWILLGGGVAMFAIAAPGNVSFDALGVLVVVGTVATLSSIPLFIAAGRNKRKARSASAYFKLEKAMVLPQRSFAFKSYPAISVKIKL